MLTSLCFCLQLSRAFRARFQPRLGWQIFIRDSAITPFETRMVLQRYNCTTQHNNNNINTVTSNK